MTYSKFLIQFWSRGLLFLFQKTLMNLEKDLFSFESLILIKVSPI